LSNFKTDVKLLLQGFQT